MAEGTSVDLAPAAVLAQRGGLAEVIRVGVAELLLAEPLARRSLWVRVGAARYFAGVSAPAEGNVRCPADAELSLAVSAAAQRDAESRATGCFVRALAQTKDWRAVR